MKAIFFSIAIALAATANAGNNKMHYFMQQPDGYASAIPYGNNPETGHYANAGDAKIYYETYGEGDPVVVLHGGGVGCTYEMGQFIDSLSTIHKVIAISTRGHGKSEIGTQPMTYAQRATDINSVIETVTSEPVTLLGFSDGAYSAYKFASMYPEKVKKLIAIGAGENVPALRKIVPSRVNDMKLLDPAFMDCQLAIMPQPERLQEYWNQFYEFYNTETISKELFMSIKCPVLMMAGELDPNAPLATVIAAYLMTPDCRLAIIAGAHHAAFIENFKAVWANILPFINQ